LANRVRTRDMLGELGKRIGGSLNEWGDERFGDTTKGELTDEQKRQRMTLAEDVVSLVDSINAEGGTIPKIEQLLNRVRLVVQPGFRPKFVKPKSYDNIHTAFQSNKTR